MGVNQRSMRVWHAAKSTPNALFGICRVFNPDTLIYNRAYKALPQCKREIGFTKPSHKRKSSIFFLSLHLWSRICETLRALSDLKSYPTRKSRNELRLNVFLPYPDF